MIARSATAQDDITGDGTTSNVILIGEIMKQAERVVQDGIHARVITEGLEVAKVESLEFLERFKVGASFSDEELLSVARSSLGTKVQGSLVESLSEIVVKSVKLVREYSKSNIDLHMIEIIKMQHQSNQETRFVSGLVLDHGARHPDMPKRLKNCLVLNLNVSLEYEKT